MANYYTDHPEFEFYLNHPEMKRIVELKERNFADKEQYPDAPIMFKDTVFLDFLGLPKKYNESKDDDVLQDGVVVSFDELAKAAKIPVDKLPDEVFKDLDAERNQFDEEKRGYEPLVASCLADEEDREFRIIINHRLFEF